MQECCIFELLNYMCLSLPLLIISFTLLLHSICIYAHASAGARRFVSACVCAIFVIHTCVCACLCSSSALIIGPRGSACIGVCARASVCESRTHEIPRSTYLIRVQL